MKNLWLPVRYLLMLVTVMLLGIVAPSIAFADPNLSKKNNGTSSLNTESPNNGPEAPATVAPQQQQAQQAKVKPKTATKPREKSILTSQSENTPVNYLRKAFSSDDESSDFPSGSGTVTQAVKVLIAAALSTIM